MAERITINSKKPVSIKENLISHRRKTDFRSNSSPVNRILYLQRTIGNQAVQRMVRSGTLQAKLSIGQPGDVYEQEADRVADAVMHMPEPGVHRQEEPEEEEEMLQAKPLAEQITPLVQRQVEQEEEDKEETLQFKPLVDQIKPLVQRQSEEEDEIKKQPEEEEKPFQAKFLQRQEEEEPVQAKRSKESSPEVSPSFDSGIESIRGGGQPLPESIRTFFEPRFQADFSGVKLHNNSNSNYLARSINARAFTIGQDMVFGTGQYSPETSGGKKLLAHELTHVVQQNGAKIIRRKILIGGIYYNPKGDYGWVKKNYGLAMVEFLKRMHNKGKSPEYKFEKYAKMHKEIRVRYFAIKGMEKVHKGCCGYPSGSGTGKLDTSFWDKIGAFAFKMKSPLPAGKNPSDAIESIFKSGAGTELECNSTMVAIQYRAMLKMLGPSKFNTKFAAIKDLIISPALYNFMTSTGTQRHPIWEKNLYKEVTISGASDLLPGDWVYFKNIADYIIKHPGGVWSGEHALYLGGGKFRGFGIAKQTESELNKELLKEYNAGLPTGDKKAIGDVPGLLHFARRPVIKEITN